VDTKGEEYLHEIREDVAGVVIGDRAFAQKRESAYMYDLGLAWKQHTGLPFVFAAWISNKPIPEQFVAAFNEANSIGLQQLDRVIEEEQDAPTDLREYYTKSISYDLNAEKRKGLIYFLSRIKGIVNTKASLQSF
jgi:chorismate dehydratase